MNPGLRSLGVSREAGVRFRAARTPWIQQDTLEAAPSHGAAPPQPYAWSRYRYLTLHARATACPAVYLCDSLAPDVHMPWVCRRPYIPVLSLRRSAHVALNSAEEAVEPQRFGRLGLAEQIGFCSLREKLERKAFVRPAFTVCTKPVPQDLPMLFCKHGLRYPTLQTGQAAQARKASFHYPLRLLRFPAAEADSERPAAYLRLARYLNVR